MNFKDWFYTEVGTDTASVAIFSRPIFGGMVRRTSPSPIMSSNKKKKKKKKKEK